MASAARRAAASTGMNLYGVSGATEKNAEFSTVKGSFCRLKKFGFYTGSPLDDRNYEFQARGDDLKVNVGYNNEDVLTFTFKGAKKYPLRSLEGLHQSFTAAMEYIGFGDMLEEDSTFFTDLQDQFGSLSREEKKVPSPARVPPKNVPTTTQAVDMSIYIQEGDETLTEEEMEKAIKDLKIKLDEAKSAAKEAEELATKEKRMRERRGQLALLRKAKQEAEDRRNRALASANSFAAKASAALEEYPPLDKPPPTRLAKKGGAGSNAFAALPTEDNDVDSGAE